MNTKIGTLMKSIAAVACIAAVIGGSGAQSASAVVTASRTGSVGPLLSSGRAVCTELSGYSTTSIAAPQTRVGRTSRYPTSTQTIWAINRIDYWTGSRWATYKWGQWQHAATAPNQAVRFPAEDLRINPVDLRNGYRTYRLATVYRWQVGQTTVGEVTNYYEMPDYTIAAGTVMLPPMVGQAPAGQSSWCEFPTIDITVG